MADELKAVDKRVLERATKVLTHGGTLNRQAQPLTITRDGDSICFTHGRLQFEFLIKKSGIEVNIYALDAEGNR